MARGFHYLCGMQQDREINGIDVIRGWWEKRRLIGLCALCGMALGVTAAFLWPKRYTAVVKLVAASQGSGLSSELSGLGSLLGMQIRDLKQEEYLSAELYPDIVASAPFLTKLFPEEFEGLSAGKAHAALLRLRKNIDVFTDNRSGLTTIRVTARKPFPAAAAADSLVARLERYLIETRTRKARADFVFAEARFTEARAGYYTAQEAWARFTDANRHLAAESAAVERDRLDNERRLAYNLYSQLASQLELARLRVQEQTPVLTLIEPAAVPMRPSSPRRRLLVLAGLLLGAALPMGWLVGQTIFQRSDAVQDQAG